MNTEQQAWDHLRVHAASFIRPGFSDRVLCEATAGGGAAPSLLSQLILSAAVAAVCLCAVVLSNSRASADENTRNLAGWREIAMQVDDIEQTPSL